MKFLTLISHAVVLFISFFANTVLAENHALLVGIANYHIKPLAGPKNDAVLLQKILHNKWSFKKRNIKLILNQAGTKKNILDNIKALYQRSKSGDNIFIYLSGHGTSAQDKAFKFPLPTSSGAFIPIDIENANNKSDLINNLIIGRNDLKPLLQQFDNNGRHVFVAIDACFSGNTVRGLYSKHKLDSRYLSINKILAANRSYSTKKKSLYSKKENSTINNSTAVYPYKNIYYLAASGEYEPAQDIKPEMLERYPTIDGKPHGAFTDTLLRILNHDLDADTNHDGIINYSELKKSLRYYMRIRGFDHTPQGLPSLTQDRGELATHAIFGQNQKRLFKPDKKSNLNQTTITKLTTTLPLNSSRSFFTKDSIFSIMIDKTLPAVLHAVKKIRLLRLVKHNAQLEIRKKSDTVLFISQAGDLILSLKNPNTTEILNHIQNQIWIKQLVDAPIKQDFNIDVDMFASGRGSTLVTGDTLGVAIKSSETAYILILNINAQGKVTVLYPYVASEFIQLQAYRLLVFKELSKVVAPFGREYLQVYAFKQASNDYRELMAKSFQRGSHDAHKLMHLIKNKAILKARGSLELVTSELN